MSRQVAAGRAIRTWMIHAPVTPPAATAASVLHEPDTDGIEALAALGVAVVEPTLSV